MDTKTSDPPLFVNSIATQLRPIVRILRYMGAYPIKSVSSNIKSKEIKYKRTATELNGKSHKINQIPDFTKLFEFGLKSNDIKIHKFYELVKPQWTSLGSWYTYFLRAVVWAVIVTFIFNIGLDMPYPFEIVSNHALYSNLTSEYIQNVNSISLSAVGSLRMLDFTLLHFSCGSFVDWLNNWSGFEREFSNAFTTSQFHTLSIRSFQKRMICFCIILPGIFILLTGILNVSNLFVFHVPFLGQVCITMATLVFTFYPVVEDCKIVIMLKTSVLAFEQLRLGIDESSKSDGRAVTSSDVIGWRDLIVTIQEQTGLACSYLKNQNLIFVAETVISCTLGIACSVLYLRDANHNQVPLEIASGALIACGYMSCNTFGRLYLKVMHAVQIPAEELLIAKSILKEESKCNDAAAKAELKFLHSMLTQNTIEVKVGDYFALNKKLLLQVLSQAVTYLIVIMQFQQGNVSSSGTVD